VPYPNRGTTSHRIGTSPLRLDDPDNLALRAQRLSWQGHRVGDANRAVLGVERGFEHVRAGQIAPLGLARRDRSEQKPAAALCVEEGGEHRRGVHVGQTEPVDRPVAGHQRHRATVADRRVAPQRGIAVYPPKLTARDDWYACNI
jgi:hypothetical protein